MRMILIVAATGCLIGFGGCEEKPSQGTAGSSETGKPAANNPPAKESADAHGDQADDGAGSDAHELGTVTIAGFPVRVVQRGEIVAGKDVHIDVHVSDADGRISAVRAWIGPADGKDAMKARITANEEGAHNHVEAPSPLPEGALMCIELELAGGDKQVGTLPLHR